MEEKVNSKRLVSVDLLKMVCAIFVIMTHSPFGNGQRHALYFSFWIEQAVPIFMVIMGFNFYNSCKRKMEREVQYESLYSKEYFLPQIIRLYVPYAIAMAVFFICYTFFGKVSRSASDWIGSWLRGGYGPGGYYTVVYLQAIVLFPILFAGLRKNLGITLIFVLEISIIWELLVRYLGFSAGLYRCSIFRLLMALCMGGGVGRVLREAKANDDSPYHAYHGRPLFIME